MTTDADIAIIGAGAAGLAAAIFAGEAATGRDCHILLLEGAKKPGAKILVSGGGRCNVTNERVTPDDYCGGPSPTIRSVLKAFDEKRTIQWMKSLGVELKLEPTGKYFPVSDSARTVLEALLRRVREVGVELRTGFRVSDFRKTSDGFEIVSDDGAVVHTKRVIVATGGLSLPKSGSDGMGLQWMQRMGHTIVPTTPALAALVLEPRAGVGRRFAEFAGVTMDARLTLASESGKKIVSREGSIVFTHFGISGPTAMDLSRHIARFRLEHPTEKPRVTFGHLMFPTMETADEWLRGETLKAPGRGVLQSLCAILPERLAAALVEDMFEVHAKPKRTQRMSEGVKLGKMTREERMHLARNLAGFPLEVVADRGYTFAETTAGGVDLREIDSRTMESRKVPGLYLCGEMLDVDGRIGGFSFQWVWATGYLAGKASTANDR